MTVTLDNSFDVYYYFKHTLEDVRRRDQVLKNPESALRAAQESLDQLPHLQYCDVETYRKAKADGKSLKSLEMLGRGRTLVDIDTLQHWCSNFISNQGWKRCLNNLKQSRYQARHRNKVVTLRISSRHHALLKMYAKSHSADSLDEMLGVLLDMYERNRK